MEHQYPSNSTNNNIQFVSQNFPTSYIMSIGNYICVEELGSGSFATVYKAYYQENICDNVSINKNIEKSKNENNKYSNHEKTHYYAIKCVKKKMLSKRLLDNLNLEITILKELKHKNIVQLIECLKSNNNSNNSINLNTTRNNNSVYLIMEYCNLGDLNMFIKNNKITKNTNNNRSKATMITDYYMGGLNKQIIKSFILQISSALKFLRLYNLIHRDIKPQIADFGFARFLHSQKLAETLCGSPMYMAPEILKQQKYDARVDLWSIGAVIYEMVFGKAPFKANNQIELINRIENTNRQLVREIETIFQRLLNSHIKDDDVIIKQIMVGLLDKNPDTRMTFEQFFTKASELNKLTANNDDKNNYYYNNFSSNNNSNNNSSTQLLLPPSDILFNNNLINNENNLSENNDNNDTTFKNTHDKDMMMEYVFIENMNYKHNTNDHFSSNTKLIEINSEDLYNSNNNINQSETITLNKAIETANQKININSSNNNSKISSDEVSFPYLEDIKALERYHQEIEEYINMTIALYNIYIRNNSTNNTVNISTKHEDLCILLRILNMYKLTMNSMEKYKNILLSNNRSNVLFERCIEWIKHRFNLVLNKTLIIKDELISLNNTNNKSSHLLEVDMISLIYNEAIDLSKQAANLELTHNTQDCTYNTLILEKYNESICLLKNLLLLIPSNNNSNNYEDDCTKIFQGIKIFIS